MRGTEGRKSHDDCGQLCRKSFYFLQNSIALQYKNIVSFKGSRCAASGRWTAACDSCAEFAWATGTWSWSRGTASPGVYGSSRPSQPPPWLSVWNERARDDGHPCPCSTALLPRWRRDLCTPCTCCVYPIGNRTSARFRSSWFSSESSRESEGISYASIRHTIKDNDTLHPLLIIRLFFAVELFILSLSNI